MSSSVTSSSYESKSGADILSNLTGIIQEKFPKINVGDIPGLDDNSNESRTNFAVFMCSLIFGMFWITYITFFNSRVVGSIVTRILNRFVQVGYVKVRLISINHNLPLDLGSSLPGFDGKLPYCFQSGNLPSEPGNCQEWVVNCDS